MRTLALVFILALAGCASLQNTPAQDRTWAAYRQCKDEGRIRGNAQVLRVEADGRYWYEGRSGNLGLDDMHACIAEKVKAAR